MIWYIRIAVVLAVVAALVWLHHHVYEEGYNDRDVIAVKEMKAEKNAELAADAEAEAKLTAANKKINALSLQMTQTISSITTNHQQEVANANAKITQLSADLHSTKLRLSIAVANPAGSNSAACTSQGTGLATGTGTETRAYVLPSTVDALVSIATGGDAAVRRANACADTYNALKEAVNAQVTEATP